MKKFAIIAVITALTQISLTAYSYSPAEVYADTPSFRNQVVTVPEGETFKAVFMSPINSETATTGQSVTLALLSDFYYGTKLVAEAGSSVTGKVISVFPAKHGTVNGKLTMRFTHIITPEGRDIPISAIVRTPDSSGTLVGGEKLEKTSTQPSKSVKNNTETAPSPNISGARQSQMTPIILGGGFVKSFWDKGLEVDLPAYTTVELLLTQPITK